MRRLVLLAVVLLDVVAGPAPAHFNMLLPQTVSARKGDPILVTYQWGHPFEHQLFDAPVPEKLLAFSPQGKPVDLGSAEKLMQAGEGKKEVRAFRFKLTPQERGDFILALETPAIWMEEDAEFLQDSVKVVVHVQAQKGWDQTIGQEFEVVPLTRPYGLQAGMVIQAPVLAGGKPLASNLIEIEHYNAAPPKELPPDEQITRTAKTDPNGIVTTTLPEPGWWCLTAQRDGGKRDRNGKSFPVRRRATLWVYVDEKPVTRPSIRRSR